ncbi:MULTISPECIES: hypothetical protein [unclassified Solwaraspora]|uniref:hypothetical protein n=1 Tax=unclassified Solwaraspora TaxID=2627926 RepID=UPI00248C15C1|nr:MULTISPECIES: hypothetical protein [unclassified Solwaraspora]WBB99090.1 hypothetical protein O7553_09455 [Solwaraspora sp. WMMA2059]WBC22357.1 hypothetical protein O7543_07910 [Solwaraspora sp. WMMA2080]WJK35593.1 hypothetical protein O7610_04215 [Solwaraspora sp. WMMA2065]
MTWADSNGRAPATGIGTDDDRQADQLAAGAERTVAAPLTVVRQHLLAAVRNLGFQLTVEQLSVIQAVRGSKLGAVTLQPARMPVQLQIGLEAGPAACRVTVQVSDRWPAKVGRNWGATAVYQDVFGSVLAAVDAALARLDPAAAAGFAGWWRNTGNGDVAAMQNAAGWAAQAGSLISRHTTRFLDGSDPAKGAPVSRTGAGTFTFVAAETVAEVPTQLADGMLTVGTLITSRPGQMPANLVTQIQGLVYRVEEYIAAAAASAGTSTPFRFTVDPADVPVVTFLHQQAQLREMLPVRTLLICTTCKLEKIVNPELERLQERNRRTRDLATTVSAVISPFVLAGRLAQTKGPAFACPRCQGLSADESVVTFCRQCGDRRTETALRSCSKCSFDFRSLLPKAPLWVAPTAVAPAGRDQSATPAVAPATDPASAPPTPAAAPPPPTPAAAPPPAPRAPAPTPVEESWPRPPGQ